MKTLMRYTITSGRVVEKRDVLMAINLDPTTKRPRGKRRGKSKLRQIERNLAEAVLRLARILNANFRGGDLFLTLKYNDERLPATREDADRIAGNFMDRAVRAYKKATGKKLRWVLVTADRSSRTGEPVRLHHHIVMDPLAWELIAKHWPEDQFSYRRLDGKGNYLAVAIYMIKNAGYRRGHRTWRSSKGLEKPVFSTPVPVKQAGSYRIPSEAKDVYKQIKSDDESGFYAAYIRYVMPARQGKDGGAVCRCSRGKSRTT